MKFPFCNIAFHIVSVMHLFLLVVHVIKNVLDVTIYFLCVRCLTFNILSLLLYQMQKMCELCREKIKTRKIQRKFNPQAVIQRNIMAMTYFSQNVGVGVWKYDEKLSSPLEAKYNSNCQRKRAHLSALFLSGNMFWGNKTEKLLINNRNR